MAVYTLYVPTTKRPVGDLAMESFRNLQTPERLLKHRSSGKATDIHHLEDGYVTMSLAGKQPVQSTGTISGYMLVWRRFKADPVPDPLSPPDEEWWANRRGRVQRAAWAHTPSVCIFPEPGGMISHHPPEPGTTTPGVRGDVCDACWQLPPNPRCGCSQV